MYREVSGTRMPDGKIPAWVPHQKAICMAILPTFAWLFFHLICMAIFPTFAWLFFLHLHGYFSFICMAIFPTFAWLYFQLIFRTNDSEFIRTGENDGLFANAC